MYASCMNARMYMLTQNGVLESVQTMYNEYEQDEDSDTSGPGTDPHILWQCYEYRTYDRTYVCE